MKKLHFTDVTPEEGKKYRRNSESEANSPYIVVGTYEGVCPSNTFSGLPNTPRLAGAYEHGILDGNLGQMVSFQSTYKSTLRIEVPVWPDVQQTTKAVSQSGSPMMTSTSPPVGNNSMMAMPVPAAQEKRVNCPRTLRTLRTTRRRLMMTPMCRRRDKVASPFGKAFCLEPRTLTLHGVMVTSMKLSPNGSSLALR